jgi:ribosome-associated toxin RatA of RatAB toxin-antitoxin module
MKFIHYPFSTLKYQLTRKASVNPKVFYQTVAETNKYSSFLPWCSESVILKSEQNYDETRLNIKFGLYNVSYLSHVTF